MNVDSCEDVEGLWYVYVGKKCSYVFVVLRRRTQIIRSLVGMCMEFYSEEERKSQI